jgi:hypothetical protein
MKKDSILFETCRPKYSTKGRMLKIWLITLYHNFRLQLSSTTIKLLIQSILISAKISKHNSASADYRDDAENRNSSENPSICADGINFNRRLNLIQIIQQFTWFAKQSMEIVCVNCWLCWSNSKSVNRAAYGGELMNTRKSYNL